MIQLVLLDLALVHPAIPLVSPVNPEVEAALSGSGEAKALLEPSEALILRVPQQARVVKLHQGIRNGRAVLSVEPRNFVEKRRTGCIRDDVTPELHLVSLSGDQRLRSLIQTKAVGWRTRARRQKKTKSDVIQFVSRRPVISVKKILFPSHFLINKPKSSL